MKYLKAILLLTFLGGCLTVSGQRPGADSQYETYAPDGISFTVAPNPWPADGYGNHRATVVVEDAKTPVVKADLKWRRPDLNPETKAVRIFEANSGEEVKNVMPAEINGEHGTILFEPTFGAGRYYIYYMPYRMRYGSHDGRYEPGWNDYLPATYEADSAWTVQVRTVKPGACQVERFEARTRFEFFTSMGNEATASEVESVTARHQENPLIYTEDRAYPIRLTRTLPIRWIGREPEDAFEGWAQPGEYYVWQVGVFAAHGDVKNVRLDFEELSCTEQNATIAPSEMTCFNQEGINWDGQPVTFRVDVPKGRVQALWCGVQIPQDAAAGTYTGIVHLTGEGLTTRHIKVRLHVDGEMLADRGEGDLWRMSRLRWLNSTIGTDDHPVAPYQALKVKGHRLTATGKHIELQDNGLPANISINDREILRTPLRLVVETPSGEMTFGRCRLHTNKDADGLVTWTASGEENGVGWNCRARLEFDSYMRFNILLRSATGQDIPVKDIRLEIAQTPYASAYFMGIGYDGGTCPEHYEWDWQGLYDSYWMGGTLAGLHAEFRGSSYHGPLMQDYRPEAPASWWNGGKGRIRLSRQAEAATVRATTGECSLTPQGTDFEFALLVTPQKPIDTKKQFSMRFFHGDYRRADQAAENGTNIVNLHHATPLNPVINYPFIVQEPLKAFIRHEHEHNRRVKLYYTIRELTNHTSEIYALKSLGGEVIASGHGGGAPWLCEHLIEDYRPAWYVTYSGDDCDAAFVQSGFSRWINYYLEGYRWMLQNYEIDGLYMDDVAFDRNVMKRMRKIMDRYRPGSIIDLHSNTAYSRGPANQYADFFPYVDRLWFGESFRYNQLTPAGWLVTFSGIPFGPMSEMLQDGGNGYLGSLYGATGRYECNGSDPVPVWNLWKQFGIEDSRMVGYWDEDCPISTSDPDVKATVYQKKGQAMIVLGNFSDATRQVRLTFDWKKLRLNPQKAKLYAPEIERYQPSRPFQLDEAIPIEAKKGWTLIVSDAQYPCR